MSRIEKALLWTSTLAVGVTGAVYAWMKFLLTTDDPYAVIHHPWQPAVLKAHILTAPVLVFAIGVIFSRHVVGRWKAGRRAGRASGATIVAVAAPIYESTFQSIAWVALGAGAIALAISPLIKRLMHGVR